MHLENHSPWRIHSRTTIFPAGWDQEAEDREVERRLYGLVTETDKGVCDFFSTSSDFQKILTKESDLSFSEKQLN